MQLNVDLNDILPTVMLASLDDDVIEQALASIMAGARAFWIQQAQQNLKTSRVDYIHGIQPVYQQGTLAMIDLLGTLPNMVEHGASGFDMRDTLLQFGDPGVRINKDGKKYRSIPFRHQTPGTQAQGGGQVMGDPYKDVVADSKALGRKIHKHAKKLKTGERLQKGLAPKLKPFHTNDIYAGMQRVQQPKAKGKGQVYYNTFRTISEDSDPVKWQHPGIEPHHFLDAVEDYVLDVAEGAFFALMEPT